MEYVREDLGLVNKHVGYVYLVDELCRVRWAGCGDVKLEEAKALENCVGVLLDRLGKKTNTGTLLDFNEKMRAEEEREVAKIEAVSSTSSKDLPPHLR